MLLPLAARFCPQMDLGLAMTFKEYIKVSSCGRLAVVEAEV
jgi:hypothetical protein